MGNKKKIQYNLLHDSKEMCKYLEERANNHKCFKFYSKSYRIENIINTHSIYLSNGHKWNDEVDKANFTIDDGYKKFAICLSYSRSENVAMWMLYSGNDGCMIDFNKEIIVNHVLKTDCVKLGKFDDKKFCERETLYKSKKEFEISLFDIVYYSDSKDGQDSYYAKRSDEVNKAFPKKHIDGLTYQKKRLPWIYEHECRIVVKVKQELVQTEDDTIAIEFPEKCLEELNKRIYDSPNRGDGNHNKSKLKGDMNWNLCSECGGDKQ